jgi:peptidoglycan/xylan/chitin deacetylase (PgdA/CDA1 family)
VSERVFSYRWDIDHRACITDGLPRILDVCDELGVKNTFFVNMGRSTNLREWLSKGGLRGSRAKLNDMEAVHLIKKIGWPRFALETLLSRPVGASFIKVLEQILRRGHELGLHGGSDHVIWSRRFAQLSAVELTEDVGNTLALYTRHFGQPAGFTSPGFKHDERTCRLVEEFGFRYDGDAIGGEPHRGVVDGKPVRHWTIPVTLCGPRTIPLTEWHGARGSSDEEIVADILKRIEKERWVVLYGHPCYEGVAAGQLRRIFRAVQEAGFRFLTHEQMAQRLYAGA